MTSVRIQAATTQERPIVANLMQLYLYDICEFEDGPLNAKGLFELDDYFELYWIESTRHPFLLWIDGQLAGFALVREISHDTFSISEFFIRRGCRRTGAGAKAATELFDRFRGTWRVAELERNIPAQAFWRRVIDRYNSGRFSEEWSQSGPRGPMQVFSNRVRE
jgi:predicted acetyltransferase